jgi:hypothetical protein
MTRQRATLAHLLRRGVLAAAAAGTAAALASCTVSATPADDPSATPSDSASVTEEAAPSPTEPSGPDSAEISADLLAAATDPADEQPIGTVTAVLAPEDVETTVDVLELRRVEGGTFLRLRIASTGETYNIGPRDFADGRFGTLNFLRELYLDDTAGGTRYLPLQFEDYRTACVCPYKPLEVGPDAQVVTAVFPPLPDGTDTVTLRMGPSDLVVEDVPVAG